MKNDVVYLTFMVGKSQQVPFFNPELKREEKREKPMDNKKDSKIARFPGIYSEECKVPRVVSKQTIGYGENGEIVYDMTRKPYRANGSGFVVSYTDKVCELLTKITAGSVLRVFFFLAHQAGLKAH